MGDRVTCPECGFLNEPGDEFCGQCGRYLGWSGGGAPGTGTAQSAAPIAGDAATAPMPTGPLPPDPRPAGTGWSGSYLTPTPPPTQGPPQFVGPPLMQGVTCRICGLVNPPGRTFCQRCGNELDPAVGTVAGTPRPTAPGASASGGGRKLVAAGLGLIVVAAVAGAAIAFGGILRGPSPTASPPTTAASGASATPSPPPTVGPTDEPTADATARPTTRPTRRPTDAPTAEPTRRPTDAPTAEPTRRPTDAPTAEPTAGAPVPTVGGATPRPPGTFECERTTAIQDPLSQGWRVQRVDWSGEGDHDQLAVTLARSASMAGDPTQAIVHVLPIDEVASTLKVVAPSAGKDAVALGLWQGVRTNLELDQALGLTKLRWITMGKDDNGFVWLVLGVRGEACYSLQAPDWSSDEPKPVAETRVIVDVRH